MTPKRNIHLSHEQADDPLLPEEVYRTILSNISDTVLITDRAGEFKFICPNVHVIFAYSAHEIRELGNITQLLGPEMLEHCSIKQGEELTNIERQTQDKDGSLHTLLVNIKAIPIFGGTILFTCRDISDRKQAEQALQASEERSRQLAEAAFEGLVIHEQGTIVEVNQSFCELYGYERSEVIGLSIMDVTAPQSRPLATRGLATGETRSYEALGLHKNGIPFDVEVAAKPINYRGRAARVVAIRDISERKKVEEALLRSESKYRLIVDTAHEGIWQIDNDSRITYVNPHMSRMFGVPQDEMIGKAFYEFVDPADQEKARQLTQQRRETGSIQAEIKYRRDDGSYLWGLVASSNLHDDDGQNIGAIAFITDITERISVEEKLRKQTGHIETMNKQLQQQLDINIRARKALAENEAALETLINNVDESIFSIDADRRLISFNTAFQRRLLGRYGIAMHKGMGIVDYLPESTRDIWLPLIERALRGESFHSSRHISMPEKGIDVHNEMSFNPILSVDEKILGAAIFVRDVTESKKAELALRASEERFRRVVENVPLAFSIYDFEEDKFLYTNPVFDERIQQLTGHEAVDPLSYLNHVHPEDREALIGWFDSRDKSLRGELEYRVILSSGEIRYMRQIIFPIIENETEILQIANFIEDVTDRKHIEQALKQNEQLLSSILTNLPTGVVVTSLDGQYLSVNTRYAESVHRTVDDYVGHTVYEMLKPDEVELWQQHNATVLKAGHFVQNEVTVSVDSTPHTILIGGFPLRDSQGDIFATGRILVDITDQKQIQDHLRELSKQIVEVQEKERRHIAGELHDEVGQSLTGVLLLLNKLERSSSDLNIAVVNQIQAVVRQLMAQIRELSLNLHPPILDNHGLLGALRWYCNHYSTQTQIQVTFKYTGLQRRLHPEIELTCYRVIQEALTNIARYAQVNAADVKVSVTKTRIKLAIEDKGVGFNVEAVQSKNATFGLTGMGERVALLSGKIKVVSSPGYGTSISVDIPVANGFAD